MPTFRRKLAIFHINNIFITVEILDIEKLLTDIEKLSDILE
jgi:hypothetical protein